MLVFNNIHSVVRVPPARCSHLVKPIAWWLAPNSRQYRDNELNGDSISMFPRMIRRTGRMLCLRTERVSNELLARSLKLVVNAGERRAAREQEGYRRDQRGKLLGASAK